MGEDQKSVATTERQIPPISNSRLFALTVFSALAGALGGWWFHSLRFGLGFLAGGSLAVVNLLWMKRSLASFFEEHEVAGGGRWIGARYIMRYVALGTILFAVYLLSPDLLVPLVLGLCSFAAAVILEAGIRLFGIIFSFGEH